MVFEKLDITENVKGPTSLVSPIVVISKKSGEVRICVDKQEANKPIKREKHLMPIIDDLIDDHIADLNGASSCISTLAQIRQAKHALNFDLLVIIINALVFSKLYYCSSVWSNNSASNMQKLQLVQNFAAQIISGATKFEHITPSLKNLRWLPIKKQVYLRDAIFAFKCMTGCAPTYLTSQFATRRQISDQITRNSQQLNIPLFKTATGQRSFDQRIVNLYNSLDKDLKLCEDLANFQQTLKSRMLNEFLKQK